MADIGKVLQDMAGRIKKIETSLRQPSSDAVGGYWVSMPPYLTTLPITATPAYPYAVTIPRKLTLKKFTMDYYVETTSSVSHYWTVDFRVTASGGVDSSLYLWNTASVPPNGWYAATAMSFTSPGPTLDPATYLHFRVVITAKTGTPGNLYLTPPMLFFI